MVRQWYGTKLQLVQPTHHLCNGKKKKKISHIGHKEGKRNCCTGAQELFFTDRSYIITAASSNYFNSCLCWLFNELILVSPFSLAPLSSMNIFELLSAHCCGFVARKMNCRGSPSKHLTRPGKCFQRKGFIQWLKVVEHLADQGPASFPNSFDEEEQEEEWKREHIFFVTWPETQLQMNSNVVPLWINTTHTPVKFMAFCLHKTLTLMRNKMEGSFKIK